MIQLSEEPKIHANGKNTNDGDGARRNPTQN
jgi:hypothetical protein